MLAGFFKNDADVGQDKEDCKLNVRKLKNLGLTESLETGYRLSMRGAALLAVRRSKPQKTRGTAPPRAPRQR